MFFNFMSNKLAQNILVTICYYDALNYPLTIFELWKYLINGQQIAEIDQKENKDSIADIICALESKELKNRIENFWGYYFLNGRKDLVFQRLSRNKISEEKFKIIQRITCFLCWVPFVRMIAVTGRVAMKNAERKSDLDLLIVFEKGHIFLGRFLSVLLVTILGKRRKDKKITNKICLNHFLSTELSVTMQDLFSAHEYIFMFPLFGFEWYQNFFKKNEWIKKYHPNFKSDLSMTKEIKDSLRFKLIRRSLERLFSFSFFENSLKKFQVAKIVNNPKTQKIGGIIVYTDDELAFWPDFEKQGPQVFEMYKKRMTKLMSE